jgi:hypothetical protein
MQILSGWKEIAAHMHQGVRTVQRWELIGLPVHRISAAGERSPVIAFVEELEAWRRLLQFGYLMSLPELRAEIKTLESEVRSLRGQLSANTTKRGVFQSARERYPHST